MFKFKNAKYLTSAVAKTGWINDDIKEICFLGRSNVGKSSYINRLTNQNNLARVSSDPGKTRMLNFFNINNGEFRFVDAPGYGFARVNHQLKLGFAKLMEEYLSSRTNLQFVCLLVDLRHCPTNDDIEMYQYLKHFNIKTFVIATKLDKLKKNDIAKNEAMIKKTLAFEQEDYFIKVSNLNHVGIEESWQLFGELLEK